jgi:predicted transcriptional regulator
MAISAIDKELLSYFIKLDEEQKKSLLQLIKTFVGNNEAAPDIMGSERYNNELVEGLRQAERGEYITLEDLEKEMGSW